MVSYEAKPLLSQYLVNLGIVGTCVNNNYNNNNNNNNTHIYFVKKGYFQHISVENTQLGES